jgi:hypothetical protein
MDKKYHEARNQDLHIGYEFEILINPGDLKSWKRFSLGGDAISTIIKGQFPIRVAYLTPEALINDGWTLIGTGKSKGFGPDQTIFGKTWDDGEEAEKEGGWMMDGFRYEWYLSAPAFEGFGTWQGAEFKIVEKKSGGFAGISETNIIFAGKLNDINELRLVSKLTGIQDKREVWENRHKVEALLLKDIYNLDPTRSTSLVDKLRPYSDVFNANKVRVIDRFEIKDRGPVWVINTKENGFPNTLGSLRTIKGWLVREHDSDEVYEIVGVELPAVQNKEDMEMEHVSILLKNRK